MSEGSEAKGQGAHDRISTSVGAHATALALCWLLHEHDVPMHRQPGRWGPPQGGDGETRQTGV